MDKKFNSKHSKITQAEYIMPAEWHPHAATWCCFPFDEELWYGHLSHVRDEYAQLILTISKFEPVHLFVHELDDSFDVAKTYFKNSTNIFLHRAVMDDIWYRDSGPLFVKTKDHKMIPTKWVFNAWGGKYPFENDNRLALQTFQLLQCQFIKADMILEGGGIDVNGQGLALTTRQCLLNQNRNPHLSQSDVEHMLSKFLGIKQCIWLNQGLRDDHTDGHIDTIARFVDEQTILCSYAEDSSHPSYSMLEENLQIVYDAAQQYDLNVIKLPLPKNTLSLDDLFLPCTYANFYMSDRFVVMPMYDDPNDALALNILKSIFSKHEVYGLPSKYIVTGGGSFHCLTQQQPAGELVC